MCVTVTENDGARVFFAAEWFFRWIDVLSNPHQMNTVYMSCTARLAFPKPEYFITHTQNHTQKNCLRILRRELYSSVLATKIDSKITKAHTMPTFALFSPSCFYHPALSHLLFVSPLFTSHLLSHLVLSLSLAPYCCYLTCLPLLPSFFPP